MRHVVIQGTPPKEWLEKAERLTDLLRKSASDDERQAIIKANEAHWRDDSLREWLIDQFHRKCWYSEAKESVSAYHVDHFRPKGRVKELDKTFREGYWWLAFRWENYRISGQLLNVKKVDLFPLNGGHPATSCNDNRLDDNCLQLEAPILLDPCIPEDAWLISFHDNGEATCAGVVDREDEYRVEKTIEILGLNREKRLVSNRMDKWNKCLEEILSYQNAGGPQPLKSVRRASAINNLKKMIRYEDEFSSVALACIKKSAPEPLDKQVIN